MRRPGHHLAPDNSKQTARLKRCERETGRPTPEGYTVQLDNSLAATLDAADTIDVALRGPDVVLTVRDRLGDPALVLDLDRHQAKALAAAITSRVYGSEADLLAAVQATPTGGA